MNNQMGLKEIKKEPFPPDLEVLIINLNRMIGHFMSYKEENAVNTLWHAEQLIKNNIIGEKS
jgi:hypothetical protein